MWGDEEPGTYRVEYRPYQYQYQPPPPPPEGRFRFSKEEKKHLLMAVGALTLAFTLLLLPAGETTFIGILIVVAMAFGAVITGFLLHEFGHKFVALRYGCEAEFRAWTFGLLIAVFSAFMGFLFAAPGAVYIRGHLTKEENGKVSAAGPLMNITMASLLLPLLFYVFENGTLIYYAIWLICFLNAFLGGFNMIPFPPLDGSKIIKWNPGIWIIMLGIIGAYGYLLWFVLLPI